MNVPVERDGPHVCGNAIQNQSSVVNHCAAEQLAMELPNTVARVTLKTPTRIGRGERTVPRLAAFLQHDRASRVFDGRDVFADPSRASGQIDDVRLPLCLLFEPICDRRRRFQPSCCQSVSDGLLQLRQFVAVLMKQLR